MVLDPVTISPDATLGDALSLMKITEFQEFQLLKIIQKIIGILTNRDVRFAADKKQLVKEIMTKDNLVTAKASVSKVMLRHFCTKIKLKESLLLIMPIIALA